jgi:AraC-like DNA-binding protein
MQLRVRSAALYGYREIGLSLGLDPDAMMRASGLDPACLNDPDRLVPAEAVFRLFERSAQKANARDLGLRLASVRAFSIMGPIALAARDEPTVRDALQVIIRFHHVHNEALHIRLSEDAGVATLFLVPGIGTPMERPVSTEVIVGVTLRILQALLGEAWFPQLVSFQHAAPKNPRPHRVFFRCPVKFGQECNALVLRSSDLHVRNRLANADLARYAHQYLESIIERTDVKLAARVRHLIYLEMPTGRCSINRVARSLGVNRRTLHRQLTASGTSYSELFNSVREEFALRFVGAERPTLQEVAALLGYSELSAFSRWYKRRFGTSPSAARSERTRSSTRQ